MSKIGFDSQKYIRLQSQHIRERIEQFGGKLYLEFGGKLFDDYHASRVLPGFAPDNKIKMLLELKDQAHDVRIVGDAQIAAGSGCMSAPSCLRSMPASPLPMCLKSA